MAESKRTDKMRARCKMHKISDSIMGGICSCPSYKVIARDEANGHADAETCAISFGFLISFVAKQDAYRIAEML